MPIRPEGLSPGTRALLGFLQPAGGPGAAARARDLPPQAWEQILEIALWHGVGPLLHRALQSGGALSEIPEPVRTRLKEERHATALLNLRKYGEFRRIAQALRERNIPLMALKGLHLADMVYCDISLRPMSDLDILVPRTEVERAIAAFHSIALAAAPPLLCHSAARSGPEICGQRVGAQCLRPATRRGRLTPRTARQVDCWRLKAARAQWANFAPTSR